MKTSELPAQADGADRERLADRLLRSTAARSYDPELDIDWSAPPQEGKLFLPEHRSSLYGTCLLYTSPSPRDGLLSRMPSSA